MHKITKFIHWLEWFLSLRFLPERGQIWFFQTGTRSIEITSSLIMIGFAYILMTSGHEFFIADPYEKFESMHPHKLACIMFLVSLAQITAACFKSARSNVLSGFILLISALVWFVVFGLFAAAYPPLSTGMITYLVLSIVCGLAGRVLISRNREKVGKEH